MGRDSDEIALCCHADGRNRVPLRDSASRQAGNRAGGMDAALPPP
ncbi:hypothetical protein [Komagataeibacter diospyri]